MPKQSKPVAYVYTRVSTVKQAKSELSLRAQQRQAIEYYRNVLRRQNVVFGGLFAERGESAFKRRLEQRSEGRKLQAILQPGDHVVVVKLDRVFRSIIGPWFLLPGLFVVFWAVVFVLNLARA